jgi:hypothetical protein
MQWVQESKRHTRDGSLKLLVYTGIKSGGDMSLGHIEEKVRRQLEIDQAKQTAIEEAAQAKLKRKATKAAKLAAKRKQKTISNGDNATSSSNDDSEDESSSDDEETSLNRAVDAILSDDEKNESKNPLPTKATPKGRSKSKSQTKGKSKAKSFTPKKSSNNKRKSVTSSSSTSPRISKKDRSPLAPIVRPQQLGDYDVIITTYSVLRTDLYHVNDNSGNASKAMRYRKKYRVLHSPLPCVEWWRVCLDEAQMVGEGTTKCAEMALLLPCVNRWGVTGTPIPRSLDDLYGLVVFLGTEPYSNHKWWQRCIAQPFEHGDTVARDHLHWFIQQVVWRRSKRLVDSQLGIPTQLQAVTRLNLSGVEKYYYRRRHEECWEEATKLRKRSVYNRNGGRPQRPQNGYVLGDHNDDDAHEHKSQVIDLRDDGNGDDAKRSFVAPSLPPPPSTSSSYRSFTRVKVDIGESDPKFKKLLMVVRRIRQACCHPQVGSKTGLISLEKSTMTMDQLTEQLALKASLDCQESQRLMFAAILGQAGMTSQPYSSLILLLNCSRCLDM